jgi:hypothetical protein
MDQPKTRQEKKKNQSEKARGRNMHTSKGTRSKEHLLEKIKNFKK